MFVCLLYFKQNIKLHFSFRILMMNFYLFVNYNIIQIWGNQKFRTTRYMFRARGNRRTKIRLAFCGQSRLVSVKQAFNPFLVLLLSKLNQSLIMLIPNLSMLTPKRHRNLVPCFEVRKFNALQRYHVITGSSFYYPYAQFLCILIWHRQI